MAVYVDDMRAPFGRMVMCHMTADTTAELLQMADRIGVARKWIQHAGTWKEHFDIALSKRALAVQLGAVEETQREAAARCIARKFSTPDGDMDTEFVAIDRTNAERGKAE